MSRSPSELVRCSPLTKHVQHRSTKINITSNLTLKGKYGDSTHIELFALANAPLLKT